MDGLAVDVYPACGSLLVVHLLMVHHQHLMLLG
jgi:hypothetical protein